MVQPPTPEGFAGGLANPAGGQRRGVFDRLTGRNRPMISVDPDTIATIGRVKEAVRSLKSEMAQLAAQAERYATAMGHATGRPFSGGGAGRAANFPEIMRPGERAALGAGGRPLDGGAGADGRGGGGGEEGRFTQREERLFLATQFGPSLVRAITGQLGQLASRESVTSRLAMAMPGQYRPAGAEGLGATSRDLQQMLRREGYGYASTGELWGGARRLGELGLMRGVDDPRSRQAVREASLVGRITGQGFGGGVEALAGFAAPQFVNQMQQYGINAPFQGGNVQLFGRGGQQGLLGQMNQLFTGGMNREQQQGFWAGAAREGTPARQLMESMGLTPDQIGLLQQYGAARAEGVGEEELQKRFKDTGESLRELQESFSELMDTLSTGLVPIIKGLNTILRPVANGIAVLTDKFPALGDAVGKLVAAFLTAAAVMKTSSFLGGVLGGGGGKGGGILGGSRVLAGAGGLLGGLSAGATALTAGGMLAGGLGGSWAGRKVGGEGWKGKAGSVLGGAAGGAAVGAGLGLIGGPLAPLTSGVGAVAGGLIGGVAGLFGDPWIEDHSHVGDHIKGYSDAELKANPPPDVKTPGGGPLRGPGNSSNLNPEFVKRLQAMFAANPRLSLTSGFRSHQEQAHLRWKKLVGIKKVPVAPVGHSNHESGYAADIGPPSEYKWLAANAPKFGLHLPMPGVEPWHWELPKGSRSGEWSPDAGGVAPSTPAPAGAAQAVGAVGTTAESAAKPKPRAPLAMASASANVGVSGSPGYSEAGRISALVGGSQIGDAWMGGTEGSEVSYAGTPTSPTGGPKSRGGNVLTIGSININLTIARGTPEEAERTARYLGTLLGDRDRMLALASNGGRG